MKYDLIIIGGGAAGMMAAISARKHHPEFSIALIDRTFALGRKILVCGAGRCNVTNINLDTDAEKRYYGAPKEFIKGVIDQFGYDEIVSFFNDLGVELYVERKTTIGKLFPTTNQAQTITELLLDEIQRNKIDVFLNTEVTQITQEESFTIHCKQVGTRNLELGTGKNAESSAQYPVPSSLISDYLILSAGGMSYPALGSNGSGYDLAKTFGHTIIQPVPAALPIESKNQLSHVLQGQKIEAEVTTVIEGREIKKSVDDVMFTKYGFSGPAVLNISREISVHINREHKSDVVLRINFFPEMNQAQVLEFLKERWKKRPDQTLEKSLYGHFPNKIAKALLQIAGVDGQIQVSSLNEVEIQNLVKTMTQYEAPIHATRGWNEAEFTAGGIETDEINGANLESKKVENLYFAGEIVNVDGDVGGFNLSWAWSSGHLAGQLK